MHKNFPSESALIADLKSAFPGLHIRPLREFGASGFDHGVWTGMDGAAQFSDGTPLFLTVPSEEDGYDGGIHTGFSAWLDARGWYIENYAPKGNPRTGALPDDDRILRAALDAAADELETR